MFTRNVLMMWVKNTKFRPHCQIVIFKNYFFRLQKYKETVSSNTTFLPISYTFTLSRLLIFRYCST